MEVGHYDAHAANDQMIMNLAKLYDTGTLTDLTVKSGARPFKVHRVALAARSEWFRKACTGEFKEGSSQVIELYEDDPDCITDMIWFCYHGKYDDSEIYEPLTYSVNMFVLGEKYLIPQLQAYATERLSYHFIHAFKITDFGGDMAKAIEKAYTDIFDPNHILRATLVDYVATNTREIFGCEDLASQYERIRDVAREIPEFAADVLIASSKVGTEPPEAQHFCPNGELDRTIPMWASHVDKGLEDELTLTCGYCGRTETKTKREWVGAA